VWKRPAPARISGGWQALGQREFFKGREKSTRETTVRIFLEGLKRFSVEDTLDKTEMACLSGPDSTAPRDAVVREGVGFKEALDFLSKGRPLSVKGQTENV
jgi:hypothetical protein